MKSYNIGPLTMEYVFKMSGLTNVADMQAVFDAMEKALEYKNEHIRQIAQEGRESE